MPATESVLTMEIEDNDLTIKMFDGDDDLTIKQFKIKMLSPCESYDVRKENWNIVHCIHVERSKHCPDVSLGMKSCYISEQTSKASSPSSHCHLMPIPTKQNRRLKKSVTKTLEPLSTWLDDLGDDIFLIMLPVSESMSSSSSSSTIPFINQSETCNRHDHCHHDQADGNYLWRHHRMNHLLLQLFFHSQLSPGCVLMQHCLQDRKDYFESMNLFWSLVLNAFETS